ncbi:M20 family metallopeptidase [Herbaspirillum rhizosphaerae]|uniref:M20 family metallopeptidase n=1 Tax=Herbaspirillum rhizosphaerae TaxID=346179 RepID=A0ABW8Z418_9BURK
MNSAKKHYADGYLKATIDKRISYKTESQAPEQAAMLRTYLKDELETTLLRLGFICQIVDNPIEGKPPLLFAERHESDDSLTVLTYGHGDVVRGYDDQWSDNIDPWKLTVKGDKWYGRGTADNKGQHSINLAALEIVLKARDGHLGYNVKCLFETGEEIGSPGLRKYCELNSLQLKSDVFIASDGPRLSAGQPTIFLGSRGSVLFELTVNLRSGGLHSGNWGGLKRNPATILAGALASVVNHEGRILVKDLLPPAMSPSVKEALGKLSITDELMGLPIDTEWGEPSLSSAEKLLGWNTLEVLAFTAGNPANPVNAIPPHAKAFCQLRFVVGTRWQELEKILRTHLDQHGFACVDIKVQRGTAATRLDPDNAWVKWAEQSMKSAVGQDIAIMPNLGGTLPNDVFADVLGLPTLWIPHSYPGCAQHAADEHMLGSIADEGMQIMTSLFWDLGELHRDHLHTS